MYEKKESNTLLKILLVCGAIAAIAVAVLVFYKKFGRKLCAKKNCCDDFEDFDFDDEFCDDCEYCDGSCITEIETDDDDLMLFDDVDEEIEEDIAEEE